MHLIPANHPNFKQMWERLKLAAEPLDALYGPANLAFYREYCGASDATDLSLLVADGTEPLCGLGAFRREVEIGAVEISCFGLPMLYVESCKAGAISLGSARRLLCREVEELFRAQSGRATILYKEMLPDSCLSLLGRLLLNMGAEAVPSFSQIIDLSLSEEALHKNLTKAFKWSVNWGKKNLTFKILDQSLIMAEHIEQFRLLHFQAAGRETRTNQSWRLQYDMVRSGEAFCVFAFMQNSLVSAALFSKSKSHCFYGVSASRRDLFDKPISHGVIWTALLHAKLLGIRYFEMGAQLFPMAPRHDPSQKELGISFFKRAFGGESRVFLDLRLRQGFMD